MGRDISCVRGGREIFRGLNFDVSSSEALAVTGPQGTNRDDDVNAILRQVGHQLRAAIYDLSLEENEERAFGDSLGELVDVTREMAPGCEVTLDIDDDLAGRSFGRRGAEVLRILGEAVTNARRHADAEHIVIRVTGTETRLSVEVSDDGRGAAAWPAPPGQGVRGMYERAQLLGADLDIRTDHTGTTVRLQVALSPPAPVRGAARPAREHPSRPGDKELVLAARYGAGPARDRLVDAFLPRIGQIARAVSPLSATEPSQLTEQGVAVLWATHLLDEIDPSDDLVVLHQGRVLAHGEVARIVREAGARDVNSVFMRLTSAVTQPGSPVP